MSPGTTGERRLAVLGHPVSHSRSPAMQNAALEALGLGGGWRYEAIDVPPELLGERLREMAAGGFAGANVTVPHKVAALALADTASDAAREIGAANTLSFEAGSIAAENTDAEGLLASLPAPRGQRALVLGAGGAARAVVWGLTRAGAPVDLWNRTPARAAALCAELGGNPVSEPAASAYELIVNSSAAGLSSADPFTTLPLGPADFRPGQTIVDLVYGDGAGPLLAAAQAAGATIVEGVDILVAQGAASLRIWTGLEPPVEVMRAAARAAAPG